MSSSSSDEEEGEDSSLEQELRWEAEHDYKRDGYMAAADLQLEWYRAKIVDLIPPEDKALYAKVRAAKRNKPLGVSNRVKTPRARNKVFFIRNGDMVKVHFDGWSSSTDEWVLFKVKGYFCTNGWGDADKASEGGDGDDKAAAAAAAPAEAAKPQLPCFCVRHYDEAAYNKYVSELPPTPEPRPALGLIPVGPKPRRRSHKRKDSDEDDSDDSDDSDEDEDEDEEDSGDEATATAATAATATARTSKSKPRAKPSPQRQPKQQRLSFASSPPASVATMATRRSSRRTQQEVELEALFPPVNPVPAATAAVVEVDADGDGDQAMPDDDIHEENVVIDVEEEVAVAVVVAPPPAPPTAPAAPKPDQETKAPTERAAPPPAVLLAMKRLAADPVVLPSHPQPNKPVAARAPPPLARAPPMPFDQAALQAQIQLEEDDWLALHPAPVTTVTSSDQKVSVDPALLLTLSADGKRPVLAVQVLEQECERASVTVERLLRDCVGMDSLMSSGRRWLKGQTLLRHSVLLAASMIVEWFTAKREHRKRRAVVVNMPQVELFLQANPGLAKQLHKAPTTTTAAIAPPPAAKPERETRYKTFPNPPAVTVKRRVHDTSTALPSPRPPGPPKKLAKLGEPPTKSAVLSSSSSEEEEQDQEQEEDEEEEEEVANEPSSALDRLVRFARVNMVHSSTGVGLVSCVLELPGAQHKQYGLVASNGEALVLEKRAKLAVRKRFSHWAKRPCAHCPPGLGEDEGEATARLCAECECELLAAAMSASATGFPARRLKAPTAAAAAALAVADPLVPYDMDKQPNSTTYWRGNAFPTSPDRVAERRTYFTRFEFRKQDVRSQYGEFRVLDHVIVCRRCEPDEVVEEEQKNSPDYFVGQIEALWEEGETRDKVCRVNWFFWTEEADNQMSSYAQVGTSDEVFTSSEVDSEPVFRVLAKTTVLSAQAFATHKVATNVVDLDWNAPAPSQPTLSTEQEDEDVLESPVAVAAVAVAAPPPSSSSGRKKAKIPAPIAQIGDLTLRGCKRCGMFGFTSPSELAGHTSRFCGMDSVDALQKRRREAGREILEGAQAPTEPTISCALLSQPQSTQSPALVASPNPSNKRAPSSSSASAAAAAAAVELELLQTEFVNRDICTRALTRANRGPFFAKDHFHQRKHLVTRTSSADGNNELQSSLLFATDPSCAEDEYWASRASQGVFSCLQPSSTADAADTDTAPLAAARCTFCYAKLDPQVDATFTCEVCPSSVVLCVDCMRRGRQGQGHLVSHPYKVSTLALDPSNPRHAQSLLHAKLPVGTTVEYDLVEITRLPHGRPRFRFGATIARLHSVCSDEFGYTYDEAKNQCAMTCLRMYFGTANLYSFPVLAIEWTAWEAAKLLDSLALHGLAWETVAPLVGTKTAVECRSFYMQHFLSGRASDQHARGGGGGGGGSSGGATIDLVSREGRQELQDFDFAPEPVVRKDAREFVARAQEFHRKRAGGRKNLLGMLKGAVYAAPAKRVLGCKVCHTGDAACDLLCLTCNEEMHSACLPVEEDRQSQLRGTAHEYYCPDCLVDERYVSEHCSWGETGRMLCELAGGEEAEVLANVQMWRRNGEWIREVTAQLEGKKLPGEVIPKANKRANVDDPLVAAATTTAAALAETSDSDNGSDAAAAVLQREMQDPTYVMCRESLASALLALQQVKKERDLLLQQRASQQ